MPKWPGFRRRTSDHRRDEEQIDSGKASGQERFTKAPRKTCKEWMATTAATAIARRPSSWGRCPRCSRTYGSLRAIGRKAISHDPALGRSSGLSPSRLIDVSEGSVLEKPGNGCSLCRWARMLAGRGPFYEAVHCGTRPPGCRPTTKQTPGHQWQSIVKPLDPKTNPVSPYDPDFLPALRPSPTSQATKKTIATIHRTWTANPTPARISAITSSTRISPMPATLPTS